MRLEKQAKTIAAFILEFNAYALSVTAFAEADHLRFRLFLEHEGTPVAEELRYCRWTDNHGIENADTTECHELLQTRAGFDRIADYLSERVGM